MGVFKKLIDLSGQVFGRWIVIKQVENDKYKNSRWLCQCSCENKTKKVLTGVVLRNGKSKSCGCLKRETISKIKFKNLIGERFGKLTVIERDQNRKNRTAWICQCDCGNVTSIGTSQLRDKNGRRDCGICDKNEYIIFDEYIKGIDYNNKEFFFDNEYYDLVKEHTWYINADNYVVTSIKGKTISMHNLIMNPVKGYEVDHKDGNPENNRKSNLRICTHQENGCNLSTRKDNKSGCKGVSWHTRDQIWEAWIGYNNNQLYLGRFNDYNNAIKARRDAEIQYFGEYRRET